MSVRLFVRVFTVLVVPFTACLQGHNITYANKTFSEELLMLIFLHMISSGRAGRKYN
jgi:hypothetical protein